MTILYPPKETRIKLYKDKIKRKNEELHALQSQILARTNGEKPDDDAVSIADYDRVTYLESEIDSMIADLKALHSLPNGSSPRPDPAPVTEWCGRRAADIAADVAADIAADIARGDQWHGRRAADIASPCTVETKPKAKIHISGTQHINRLCAEPPLAVFPTKPVLSSKSAPKLCHEDVNVNVNPLWRSGTELLSCI